MKKLFLTLVMMLTLASAASAATIGYVDYPKIIEGYPLAQKYKKELETKSDALKKYLDQKEGEIKNAKDTAAKTTIRQQALAEVDKRQKEYAALKATKEKEIDTKIRAASEKIRSSKKLDIMLRSDGVVAGGQDYSADVIKELNK